jgi:Holliday junction resolvasome RuvABC endonuclease subunit
MRIVGIDYSLSSPCVCICDPDDFSFSKCKFYFLTDAKKFNVDVDNLQGELHEHYFVEEERFHNITKWVLDKLKEGDIIYMEGYSMGSTGRVFNIAENAGLLKHYLWKRKHTYNIVPPTVIKKFATGKGNANKQALQEYFEAETGYYIKKKLSMTDKQSNPSSDIIDSYYICKYGVNMEKDNA